MANVFTGSMKFAVRGNLTNATELGVLKQSIDFVKQYNLTNGVGADEANQIFTDHRTLAASASESLDLYGGLSFGSVINFTKIKGILIVADSANTNNVLVGGGSFLGWEVDTSDKIKILPGGSFMIMAPNLAAYAVTNSSADTLTIANSSSGTAVTYDIVLIGTV